MNLNRRTYLKEAAVVTTAGLAFPAHAASAASPQQNLLFSQNFEQLATGVVPSDWLIAGNADQGVVDTTAAEGGKSFRMKGHPGGCWEAISHTEIAPLEGGQLVLQGAIQPTTDGAVGCHKKGRGNLSVRSAFNQTTYPGNAIPLFRFGNDGRITGPDGVDYGSYEPDRWHSFEVKYERSAISLPPLVVPRAEVY